MGIPRRGRGPSRPALRSNLYRADADRNHREKMRGAASDGRRRRRSRTREHGRHGGREHSVFPGVMVLTDWLQYASQTIKKNLNENNVYFETFRQSSIGVDLQRTIRAVKKISWVSHSSPAGNLVPQASLLQMDSDRAHTNSPLDLLFFLLVLSTCHLLPKFRKCHCTIFFITLWFRICNGVL